MALDAYELMVCLSLDETCLAPERGSMRARDLINFSKM